MSMKTRFKCACVVGLVYGALVFVNAAEFHVSPTGSNLNPGTADQPFQTIERARDAIRVLKSKSGLPDGGVEVVIHGGEYRLTQTVELTPQDSGEKDRPIRYRAARDETPMFTSAQSITGWQKYAGENPAVTPAAKEHLWFANVPQGWKVHSFFVNGQPQPVASFPKSGTNQWRSWPRVQGKPQLTPEGMRVTFPTNLLTNLPSNGDVEVNFLPVEYWNTLAVLKKIEGDTALLASRNPCTWYFDGRYFDYGSVQLRNALTLLDQPGEWCVDSAAGRVYYWPPDETMAGKKVAAPALHELIRLQGDDLAARDNHWRIKFDTHGHRVEKTTPPLPASSPSAFDQLVRYVELNGLTFEATDRLPEDEWPADWLKRNSENPDGALFLQGVEVCVIKNCVFRQCGAYAVVLDHFARRVSVLQNEMTHLGSGGVEITGYGPGTLDVNHHHSIRRNYIHDTGRDYMHSAAVTIFGSGNNDVSLNWIADVPYAAVQISGASHSVFNNPGEPQQGPSFDLFGDRTAQFQMRRHELPVPNGRDDPADYEEIKPFLHTGGNWVARNIVDEYMATMGDGGALYCWSVDHDNVWLENLLQRQTRHGNAWVIHMDDWTGRTLVAGNLAWAAPHADTGHGDVSNWQDNSQNPTTAARPVSQMMPGTSPPVFATRRTVKTLCYWLNNTNRFPDKPPGFDDRFAAIQADAIAEGGWPSSVTKNYINQFLKVP